MVSLCSLLVKWGDSEGGGCVRQGKACRRGHSSGEQWWRGGGRYQEPTESTSPSPWNPGPIGWPVEQP